MRREVHIYRSLPLKSDSRVLRYKEIYSSYNVIFHTWEDELYKIKNDEDFIVNCFPLKKGGNFFLKVVKLIFYQIWVTYIYLKSNKDSTHLFMDVDTCFFTFIFFSRRKTIVDIVDPISQTKFVKLPKYKRIIDKLEFFIASKSEKIIVPHKIRLEYYNYLNLNYENQIQIIENVPFFKNPITYSKRNNDTILIGYFGTLDDKSRGIEYLLSFVVKNNLKVSLIIGGRGVLENRISLLANKYDNISFIGRYDHNDLPNLVSKVNFYWSYYSPSIILHEYAIPNKFYEHLQLDIPIIVSKIIPQSNYVRFNETGIVIEDINILSFQDFYSLLIHYKFKAGKISSLWEKTYNKYYDKIKL